MKTVTIENAKAISLSLLLNVKPEEDFWLQIEIGLAFLDKHVGLKVTDRKILLSSAAYWAWFLVQYQRAADYLREDPESVHAIRMQRSHKDRLDLYQFAILDTLKDMEVSIWGAGALLQLARKEYLHAA